MSPDLIFWGIAAVVVVAIIAIFLVKRKKEKEASAPVPPVRSTPSSDPIPQPDPKPKPDPLPEEKDGGQMDKPSETLSTDMKAKEAIDYIRNTAAEDLKGFVPEDEDRVTVQRALEKKQED